MLSNEHSCIILDNSKLLTYIICDRQMNFTYAARKSNANKPYPGLIE